MTARLHSPDFLDLTTRDALRSLDPADNLDTRMVDGPRAQDTLTRILATDTAGPAVAPPVRTGRARRPRRRWVVAAALVGVGALVVAPGMLHSQTAYASWSATAKAITPAEAAAAGKKCQAQYAGPGGFGPGSDGKMVAQARTLLVESRGVWTFVLLTGPGEKGRGGFQATCLMKDYAAPGAGSDTGGGGGGEAESYDGEAVVLAPDMAEVTGGSSSGDQTGSTSSSIGRVGSEVASVVINTVQQGPVTATIHDGYFAAWWPGPALDSIFLPRGEKTEPAPTQPPEPTYTLILKDGTIRADIPQTQLWSKRS
jgi:hypothetical protein